MPDRLPYTVRPADDFNFVANYYRPGPDTPSLRPPDTIFDIWSASSRAYIDGNIYEGNKTISKDNHAGVIFTAGKNSNGIEPLGDVKTCLVNAPFKVPPISTDTAAVAYQRVLLSAGAILPKRDAVDQRIIAQVRNRTGAIINTPTDVGGWPDLASTSAPPDTDHDGIPDDWEIAHHLNPKDPADGAQISSSGRTNLEDYLDELAAK